ncbi:hypothetical protein DL96DRAFT_1533410 [Flagelloscypha sp. PMI_526]|nr:hypothetical protein DL96DRAFT_1533410 [Flagelloscypha sp. PMI_526]
MGMFLVSFVAVLVACSPHLLTFFQASGISRLYPKPIGNNQCHTFPQLAACEKILLHPLSAELYLACSTRFSRASWTPTIGKLDPAGMSKSDYVARFRFDRKNPLHSTISHLDFHGISAPSLHGMDIHFPSSTVILINHRAPTPEEPKVANSVIEWLFISNDGTALTHHFTFDHSAIGTPNDIAITHDGMGFWFTNDHGMHKSGWATLVPSHFAAIGSLGYCSLKTKTCRIVYEGLSYPNGVARRDNQLVVASSGSLGITYILDIHGQEGAVGLNSTINTGHLQDNASIDSDGNIWLAVFPHAYKITKAWDDLNSTHPSAALRLKPESGTFVAQKIFYQHSQAFQDDGKLASGATSVVFDPQKKLLFLSGVVSPALTVCQL